MATATMNLRGYWKYYFPEGTKIYGQATLTMRGY